MTYFRKRFDKNILAEINESIVRNTLQSVEQPQDKSSNDSNDDGQLLNQGKLIVDATCTLAEVAYPTDLNLLNEAREKTEAIIDTMHARLRAVIVKYPAPDRYLSQGSYSLRQTTPPCR